MGYKSYQKEEMSDEQVGQLRKALDSVYEIIDQTWLHCPLDDAPRVQVSDMGGLRGQLSDMVESVRFYFRAWELGKAALGYMINEVAWSDEELEMWGRRMNKELSEEEKEDFDEKVGEIMNDYIVSSDGDYNLYDLQDTYGVCVDWMWDVYDGLKERYGI